MLDTRGEASRIPLEAGQDITVAIAASALVVAVVLIIKYREKKR